MQKELDQNILMYQNKSIKIKNRAKNVTIAKYVSADICIPLGEVHFCMVLTAVARQWTLTE